MGRMIKALIIVPILVIRVPAYANQPDIKSLPEHPIQAYKQIQPQQALSDLLAIPSFRAHQVNQPVNDLDTLYKLAPDAQQELETLAAGIADSVSAKVVSAGLKGQHRAAVKVDKELNGDVSKLTDIVRITIESDSINSLNQAYEKLATQTQTLEVINRFQAPRPSGYRDLKVLVTLPESQLVAEVQLHLNAISKIKNGPEHSIYEQIQRIERDAVDRDLTEFEVTKIGQLRQQSRKMYQMAWAQYQPYSMAV
ncbi:hypothetical protein [Grimontia sp. NTOU-MAR1]|uniref:hypothetical protein n=1 Tax=Grimontia sp. NTOU-MAR1 TaxID=3111011 RepID=UPI002DB98AC0|nr:hypothetical protein [Grimontia sp. NTOU-MAR1]WRV98446.1 hypothetical protein VP504_03135 [Grimontia sp. NTOU-MAR1]